MAKYNYCKICEEKMPFGKSICDSCAKFYKPQTPQYSDFPDLESRVKYWAKSWISRTKRSASRREVTISEAYLVDQFYKALERYPRLSFDDSQSFYYPSVDRVDSDKNYEPGNIEIVYAWVNSAKGCQSKQDFEECIKHYYENHLTDALQVS